MSTKNKSYKYRSRDGGEIRVVTTTGHVAIVGPEYRELPPIYHNAAISAGCECDAPTVRRNDAKVQSGPNDAKTFDAEVQIERALKKMLERDKPGDFNPTTGDPSVTVVKELVGVNVKRAQITPVWKRLQEEAAEGGDGTGDAGDED